MRKHTYKPTDSWDRDGAGFKGCRNPLNPPLPSKKALILYCATSVSYCVYTCVVLVNTCLYVVYLYTVSWALCCCVKNVPGIA